ncbi:LysR family transcriptional regulator [Aestuariicoccus sp. MJ-SS9]|uniref:LysR family transcriptional regulator n=1 Tax=Aestuariicoccus sp. MJ-SS9 TaxID=3079855 RepID=UPI0029135396|nr:LysR family transcriptional regulator [Aestuariicoccus sp. MJ-SS9]MDU8910264.1 LysR family transcriptional regulator [Aestuariicoccus sp. MJ-SS9]
MRNLDITTLRSFVAVAESGGVTRAAGFLNLTQSAVSMQLKRLEELLDQKVLERSGRGVVLTPAGQQLLGYAQKMVALNDEIYAKLTAQEWEGEIILGAPHDIIYPAIPRVMKQMQRAFPRVKLQLHSSYTSDLKAQFARGGADIILTTEPAPDRGGEVLLDVPLRWYGASGGQAFQQRPLRVAFSGHCAFSPGAIAALDAGDIAWELAVNADSDRAIEVTVSADMAVTAVLEGHETPYYEQIPASAGLPDLGTQKVVMYAGNGQPQITDALAGFLRQEFGVLATGKTDLAAE